MSEITLIVGTNSTWSIRAWLCLKMAGLNFDELVIDLNNISYKEELRIHSETMLVPVLTHNSLNIHDSFAIAEYANELSNRSIYPDTIEQRAIARSLCAELHSGFMNLRALCPFTFDTPSPVILSPEIEVELSRITNVFSAAQGEFMYEHPSIVDAFYSVLAYRLLSYGIKFKGKAGQYQQSLLSWELFNEALIKARSW